jgi:hypothetical protein
MKYRWKLLIMLMIVEIIPPLTLRTFGVMHLHKLGNENIFKFILTQSFKEDRPCC